MSRRNREYFGAAAILLLITLTLTSCASSSQGVNDYSGKFSEEVSDTPYEWVLNYNEDMQLPELPTGCEATAGATMMRMNGILVSKEDVADAMPKSDEDFVNCFIGDPYSYSGWACSAPCLTNTLNGFLDIEEKFAAVELTGTPLQELPTPCCVWVTANIEIPDAPVREKNGYGLFRNSHCVVLRGIHDDKVSVVDPLGGGPDYDLNQFESVYDAMGRQAVYVTDIDTAVHMISERGVG